MWSSGRPDVDEDELAEDDDLSFALDRLYHRPEYFSQQQVFDSVCALIADDTPGIMRAMATDIDGCVPRLGRALQGNHHVAYLRLSLRPSALYGTEVVNLPAGAPLPAETYQGLMQLENYLRTSPVLRDVRIREGCINIVRVFLQILAQNPRLERLTLDYEVEIPWAELATLLRGGVHGTLSLRKLAIAMVNDGMEAMDALRTNHTLERIKLTFDPSDTSFVANGALLECLHHHPTLRHLVWAQSEYTEGFIAEYDASLLDGALSDYLIHHANTCLTHLTLLEQTFTASRIRALLQALRSNQTLLRLALRECIFDEEATRVLEESVSSMTTTTSLRASNHSEHSNDGTNHASQSITRLFVKPDCNSRMDEAAAWILLGVCANIQKLQWHWRSFTSSGGPMNAFWTVLHTAAPPAAIRRLSLQVLQLVELNVDHFAVAVEAEPAPVEPEAVTTMSASADTSSTANIPAPPRIVTVLPPAHVLPRLIHLRELRFYTWDTGPFEHYNRYHNSWGRHALAQAVCRSGSLQSVTVSGDFPRIWNPQQARVVQAALERNRHLPQLLATMGGQSSTPVSSLASTTSVLSENDAVVVTEESQTETVAGEQPVIVIPSSSSLSPHLVVAAVHTPYTAGHSIFRGLLSLNQHQA
jgi:hypothetical protein